MPTESVNVDAVAGAKAKEIKFQLPALDVLVVGKWVWVSGPTYPLRAQLVGMGLRWSKEKSKWYWKPAGQSYKDRPRPYGAIIAKYGELRVQPVAEVA